MADTPEDTRNVSDEEYVEVTVLSTGGILEYIIPSFPIYKATLQEVKLQWEEADGTIHVFDGFAKECELLDKRTTPAMARIMFNYDSAFIIEVGIFNHVINNVQLEGAVTRYLH